MLARGAVWVLRVGCRVSGVGCRVSGVGCRVLRVGCRVLRVGCCVLRVGCCVLRVGCCVLRVACCTLARYCRVEVCCDQRQRCILGQRSSDRASAVQAHPFLMSQPSCPGQFTFSPQHAMLTSLSSIPAANFPEFQQKKTPTSI
eukprot:3483495-Rhodomonas_salina.3